MFAPSWNKSGKDLFNDFAQKIIELLINKDFEVIFRPLRSIIRNKSKFTEISNKFSSNSKFILDKSIDNFYLNTSSLLITDTSTIAMEFALAFRKPVIYFNYTKKIHNKDYKSLNMEPIEEIFRKEFGINVQSLEQLNSQLDNVANLISTKNYSHNLKRFEKKYLYDYTNSIISALKFLNKD